MSKRGRGRPRKNSVDDFPEFMKVFLTDKSSEQIQIPQAFVQRFRGLIHKKWKLQGFGAKLWDVDVEEETNGKVFIKKGWQAFVNHHCLTLGEFLVFKHERDSLFSVKIFRTNGCKAEATKVKIEELEEETEAD